MNSIITVVIVSIFSQFALANSWIVDGDRSAGFAFVQEAIDEANDSDEPIALPGSFASEDLEMGACCMGDVCFDSPENYCQTLGGIWNGVGSTCASTCGETQIGACCLDDQGQCFNTPGEVCSLIGGVWQGVGSLCQYSCSVSIEGACCMGSICFETSDSLCTVVGGNWQGEYTSCEFTCGVTVMGACCLGDHCFELPSDFCSLLGGNWQGSGATCEFTCDVKDLGACCMWDYCFDAPSQFCEIAGGNWYGKGSFCQDSFCANAQAKGSCCINGGCLMLLENECASVLGSFLVSETCSSVKCDSYCPADLNNDGIVEVNDILEIISSWGICP